jgi:hypothetical protein
MQGISPIEPLFAKICLENICKFSRIREIPYAKSQGIILREQGNNSAFRTGTGNLAQNRSALPTYLISSKRIYIVDKTIINRHVCGIITEGTAWMPGEAGMRGPKGSLRGRERWRSTVTCHPHERDYRIHTPERFVEARQALGGAANPPRPSPCLV